MYKDLIERIIEENIQESDTLEFKSFQFKDGKFSSLETKNKDGIFKEICAFANYNGGKIIIGIKEDENHNPSEITDVGVNKETFEVWEQSFRGKLAVDIIPSLYGVKVELVSINADTNCIVIDVPRSVLKPHALSTGSNHNFYIRNGNTCAMMKYNDLKNSFDALTNKQQNLELFRNERISSILNGEVDDFLITAPILLLHIVPEVSFDESVYIDLKSCAYNTNFSLFDRDDYNGDINYNPGGLFKSRRNHDNNLSSYLQIFYNGCIEVGEIYLMNVNKDGEEIYCFDELEKTIAKKVYLYCKELSSKNLGYGFYISFTLLNVKGCYSRARHCFDATPDIKQNIIKSPFIKWDINEPYTKSMYQFFNRFANIFGSNESYLYDNGEAIQNKFDFLEKDSENL